MEKSFLIIIILCLLLAFTACVPLQPVAQDSPQTDIPKSPQDLAVETTNPPLNTTSTAHNEQENKPTESPQPTPVDEDRYFDLASVYVPKDITELELQFGDSNTLSSGSYLYQDELYRFSRGNHPSNNRNKLVRDFSLDMIPFEELTSLEQLIMSRYTGSMQIPNKCPSLTRLYMESCDISQFDSIDHLLHITLTKCQGIDWNVIKNAPHLESLNMYYNLPEDIGIINGIQNLKRTTIGVPYDPEYLGQRAVFLTKDSFVFDPPKTMPYSEDEVRMLVFEKGATVIIEHLTP